MHLVPDGSKYVGTLGATTEEVEVSATVTAAANNQVIAAVAGKRNFIRGFMVTGGGATAASVIAITVTGLTNTLQFNVAVPAGATLGIFPLMVEFPVPLAATADNTAITVNIPSFGAGNTNAAAAAFGFRI